MMFKSELELGQIMFHLLSLFSFRRCRSSFPTSTYVYDNIS